MVKTATKYLTSNISELVSTLEIPSALPEPVHLNCTLVTLEYLNENKIQYMSIGNTRKHYTCGVVKAAIFNV